MNWSASCQQMVKRKGKSNAQKKKKKKCFTEHSADAGTVLVKKELRKMNLSLTLPSHLIKIDSGFNWENKPQKKPLSSINSAFPPYTTDTKYFEKKKKKSL